MYMPRQIGHSIEKLARQAVGKDWGLYAALLDHWREIVGEAFALVASPVKVTFPHQPNEAKRRNGTLVIRLPKGLVMEFTFKTEQIRQRINAYFGYDAIGTIKFDPVRVLPVKSAPSQPPDPALLIGIERDVKSVENKELRDVLQSLGEAVLTSRNDRF